MTCLACTGEEQRRFSAREMMFGFRDRFDYLECARCASLQIAGVPAELGRYYPEGYYSFGALREHPAWKRALMRARAEEIAGGWSVAGAFLRGLTGSPRGVEPVVRWVRRSGVGADSAILDVGCGTGELLVNLHTLGFNRLEGIDPFVERDLRYPSGVRIWRRDLADHTGSYDLLMMHHAFEHMMDPVGALAEAHRLVKPGGFVLVRVPVAGTHAWREYGAGWVQLDPPRHLFIPSEGGMRALAERTGFVLEAVEYDSTAFQFWASEQYRLDVPLMDARSHLKDPAGGLFAAEQIARWEAEAQELNRRGEGDQAAFYLRRA